MPAAILSVYSEVCGAFSDDEAEALEDLSKTIGLALDTLAERQARAAADTRYRATLDSMLEGAILIGRDWRCLYANDAAARHVRHDRSEMLGRRVLELSPWTKSQEAASTLRRCMDDRIPRRLEFEVSRMDGASRWLELSVQPVPEGLFVLSPDMTARRAAEAALRASEERLRDRTAELEDAREIAGLGIFRRDLRTSTVTWSPNVYRISALDPGGSTPTAQQLDAMITPESLARRDAAAVAAVPSVRPWEVELEMRRPDGSSRWVWQRGVTEVDAAGRPNRRPAAARRRVA